MSDPFFYKDTARHHTHPPPLAPGGTMWKKETPERAPLFFSPFAPGYTPRTADPFRLANSHNRRCYMPVCVVRGEDEHIDFEYSYLLDEEVSEEFVRENCVVMPIRCILRSFADLEKEYQP